jgi:predicted TIM-barrel fold metal-dependent hydrolase
MSGASGGADSVFDADIHLHELDADLAPYFELPWRRVLEESGLVREGPRAVRGERLFDVPGYSPLTAYDPLRGDYPEAEPHRITSSEILLADLASRGVDAGLVFPGRLLRAAQSTDDLYVANLMRAYNRYLAERWIDPKRGIYGAIMAANQTPDEAAAEIRNYADSPGFAAVYLPMSGNYPLWGDRMYRPIFAAAEEVGLPVVLQGALTIHTVFPYQLHHLPTALAKQTLSQTTGAMANLVSLITTGVFARFPRLRIVVNDVGIAWLPSVADRLDHFYAYLREDVPELTRRPSEYIREQLYLTTHPIEDDARLFESSLAYLGADHLLFGSDWPHFDADEPDRIAELPLATEVKRQILVGNARQLFRLA